MTTEHKPAIELLTTPPTAATPPEDGIGERIRLSRKEHDISVDELAALTVLCDQDKAAGISRATIYSYESNASKPGARELRILCESLDVSPNYLLLGREWDDGMSEDATIARMFKALLDVVQETSVLPDRDANRRLLHSLKLEQVKKMKKK